MDILNMRKVFENLSFSTPRVTKNSTSVSINKKMSMTFTISNQDVHTKQPTKNLSKQSNSTVVIHNALVIKVKPKVVER